MIIILLHPQNLVLILSYGTLVKSHGDKLVSFSLGNDSVEKLPNALLYPIPRCPAVCTHERENHTAGLPGLIEIQGVMVCAVEKSLEV